ncbi:MAG: DUF6498-containing protein [bacterium]|nr:DUF6498-containing protein [bacterium]
MNRSTHLLFRLLVIAFPFLAAGSRNPKITGLALVVGNLLPLLGVLFFEWSVMEILWIYWAESAIIGVINLIAMSMAISHSKTGAFQPIALLGMIPLGAFFCAHFGGFMAGHAVFLTFMPEIAAAVGSGANNPAELIGADKLSNLLGCGPEVIAAGECGFRQIIGSPIAIGVAGLIGSHGVSFFVHFIRGREYYATGVMDLFAKPYGRIILMHLTIILGAFALVGFSQMFPGQAITTLAGVWVMLKIIVDLRAHQKEYQKTHQKSGEKSDQDPDRADEDGDAADTAENRTSAEADRINKRYDSRFP